jgi:hypothetical protein
VEPLAVGIKVVFGGIFVHGAFIGIRKLFCGVPGGSLHTEKFYISAIVGVFKVSVRYFVQK